MAAAGRGERSVAVASGAEEADGELEAGAAAVGQDGVLEVSVPAAAHRGRGSAAASGDAADVAVEAAACCQRLGMVV